MSKTYRIQQTFQTLKAAFVCQELYLTSSNMNGKGNLKIKLYNLKLYNINWRYTCKNFLF